jgi:hypothetical protein
VQVQALAGIGRADFEEAYHHASKISCAGTIAAYPHGVQDVLIDLVEAAVHTGRSAEAAAHVAAIPESNIAALSSRFALVALGSAAIAAATDRSAVELFEEALAVPGADRWSFWMARVQLAYGERPRRMRTLTEARLHLTAAIETFERLGAVPWASRARSELRATGQSKPRVGCHARVPLTKRGVATRAALRDALGSVPPARITETGRNRPESAPTSPAGACADGGRTCGTGANPPSSGVLSERVASFDSRPARFSSTEWSHWQRIGRRRDP